LQYVARDEYVPERSTSHRRFKDGKMAVALRLDWAYCPDGVELYERPEPKGASATLAGGALGGPVSILRPRTARRKTQKFYRSDVANAIALQFAKANTDDALLAFCGEYGLPGWVPHDDGASEMPLLLVRDVHANLLRLIGIGLAGATHSKTPLLTRFFPVTRVVLGLTAGEASPVLMLQPETLAAFMYAEAALIISGNTGIMACENCGSLFVTQSGRSAGGKRSDARYCSSKCRLAAWRKAEPRRSGKTDP
jgi:hypothetical protein